MNEILMRAVVEAAAFLELAGDDVLDPDVAVKELESMAYRLGQLDENEKRQLLAFTQAEAERALSFRVPGIPSAVSRGHGPLSRKRRLSERAGMSPEGGTLWRLRPRHRSIS